MNKQDYLRYVAKLLRNRYLSFHEIIKRIWLIIRVAGDTAILGKSQSRHYKTTNLLLIEATFGLFKDGKVYGDLLKAKRDSFIARCQIEGAYL